LQLQLAVVAVNRAALVLATLLAARAVVAAFSIRPQALARLVRAITVARPLARMVRAVVVLAQQATAAAAQLAELAALARRRLSLARL
jgi:hypothetical protein